jgi:hypothetical protein
MPPRPANTNATDLEARLARVESVLERLEHSRGANDGTLPKLPTVQDVADFRRTSENVRSLATRVHPLSISSANCVAVTGMSWSWVTRFAREHGVPLWRVGARKQLIPAAQLVAAMERVASEATTTRELSFQEELAAIEAKVTAAMLGAK